MRYREPVFRPPSEANSYLLPVTDGCSHNKCSYCAMYITKRFSVRPLDEVLEDIEQASRLMPQTRRVFLLDGDAMTLSAAKLTPILEALRAKFPQLQRVSSYTNAISINNKTDDELAQLRALGLTLGYLGLETGDEVVNERIVKGASIDDQVRAVQRAQAAGIKMSVMVLLGMGGRDRTREHAIETGKVVSRMDPRYISCLCVTPVPGTPLHEQVESGTFEMITPEETLEELRLLVEHLDLSGAVFRSNHASNYLPLGGRLPVDKERLLAAIAQAEAGEVPLKPEYLRGL